MILKETAQAHPRLFKNILGHMATNKKSLPFGKMIPDINPQRLQVASVSEILQRYTETHSGEFNITDFKVGDYYASISFQRVTGYLSGGGITAIYKRMRNDSVKFEKVDNDWIS